MSAFERPKFQFIANNKDKYDHSGVAIWTYEINDRLKEVKLDLPTFVMAHMINELVVAAYDLGKDCGADELRRKVYNLLR